MTSNDQNDLISVIVPVYKVEPYLDRCVQSIVGQTYKNLEIILVDDGSPDNCPAMCDAWAERDSRVRVIHKTNGGLSDARNAGMDAATGEYIAFVDSDDWIEPVMYEELLKRSKSTGSDIVSCDAVRVWADGTPSKKMVRVAEDRVMNKSEAMQALIQASSLIQTVWNKLYKSFVAKKIQFEKGKLHEDEFWSWQVVAQASRVATTSGAYYNYFQRPNSIMRNGYTGFPMLVIDAKLRRHSYIREELPDLDDIDSEDLLNTCFFQGIQVLRYESREKKREYFCELKKTASDCKFSEKFIRSLSMDKRAKLYLKQKHIKAACAIAVLRGVE